MADLVYTANVSVDGYTEDPDGRLDWSAPDEEFFSFVTELERPAGTYLYGRRMYEAMLYWESAVPDEGYVREFAEMWRDADKVVYSRSLESVTSARTRLEHDFDPEAVRRPGRRLAWRERWPPWQGMQRCRQSMAYPTM